MGKIRVLIADDSFFMRRVISDILRDDPDIEIVGEATDGWQTLEQVAVLHPHVVTLDIEMPRMDGVETLRRLMASTPHPSVVIVSGHAQKGGEVTLECLRLGAADFIIKPSGSFSLDMSKVKSELQAKVRAAASADTTKLRRLNLQIPRLQPSAMADGVVVIGASTGGPVALEALLPLLPAHFPLPVVVAQHLPKEFSSLLAARLQKTCQLAVAVAEQDQPLMPGTIYLASGGTTTTLVRRGDKAAFAVIPNTHDIETPSVSALMESAADMYGAQTIGVILTGMGKDGLAGMEHIKQCGGQTIVQDEATSVVFGMGREVVAHGLADAVVPLDQITPVLGEATEQRL